MVLFAAWTLSVNDRTTAGISASAATRTAIGAARNGMSHFLRKYLGDLWPAELPSAAIQARTAAASFGA